MCDTGDMKQALHPVARLAAEVESCGHAVVVERAGNPSAYAPHIGHRK